MLMKPRIGRAPWRPDLPPGVRPARSTARGGKGAPGDVGREPPWASPRRHVERRADEWGRIGLL